MSQAAAQLRVSYIWRDEVMDDAVLSRPGRVTLGSSHKVTFTTPNLGLPKKFAILRPGARGYLLTLGKGMGGRICLGGEEMDVAGFVERGGAHAEGVAGDFRAAPVSPGDWGVVHLDRKGHNSIFFHFVPPARPLPRSAWRDSENLRPALAFAIILHAILLAVTYSFKDDDHSLVFPGRRGLLTEYLVKRPPAPEQPKLAKPVLKKDENKKKKATAKKSNATRRKAGRSGGRGKKRATVDKKLAKKRDLMAQAPDAGLTSKKARKVLDDLLKKDPLADIRLPSNKTSRGDPGKGRGRGGGVGNKRFGFGTRGDSKGKHSGGGGTSHADAKTSGKPTDTGHVRKGPSGPGGKGLAMRGVVRTGSAQGSFGGLTKAEIDRAVRRRQGLIRACYQKELNRSRSLGGKVVVTFRISGAGRVTSARIRSSGLRNATVHDCMLSRIRSIRFPGKGGAGALVNYPFIFSSGA